MKNFKILTFLLLIPLYSQNSDPLLSGEWQKEIFKEEAIFYNKLIENNRPQNISFKKDYDGRVYKEKWNGEKQFSINPTYKEVFPKSSQVELHFLEAKELAENGHYIEAIRLLKGIRLCYKLEKNHKGLDFVQGEEAATKLLNEISNKYSHKQETVEGLTEPYGCFSTPESLVVESILNRYRFEVPVEFSYNFPNMFYNSLEKNSGFHSKVNTFRINVEDKPKFEDEYQNTKFEYENQIFWDHKETIRLVIATTNHFSKLPLNKNNYYKIWDVKRGLSKSIKRNTFFYREDTQDNSVMMSHYYQTNKNGNFHGYTSKEFYHYNHKNGLAIFLIYPDNYSEQAETYWKKIILSIKIKDF
ncbi:MAG: hypothetical protein H7A23_24155 [Leptospiraceae bacterium]|nr:hypothetical protein [Leptospiraceae bacterium]